MKKHSGQQIVVKLREADVKLGKGLTVPEVCKKIGVSEQTYYRWRQKYGGMSPAGTGNWQSEATNSIRSRHHGPARTGLAACSCAR
jgi:transposase-like protein